MITPSVFYPDITNDNLHEIVSIVPPNHDGVQCTKREAARLAAHFTKYPLEYKTKLSPQKRTDIRNMLKNGDSVTETYKKCQVARYIVVAVDAELKRGRATGGDNNDTDPAAHVSFKKGSKTRQSLLTVV